MSVLVVVVTYNATKWIHECFGSLRKSSVPLDIIVIDNKSTDSTIKELKENYPEAIIVQPSSNLGFGQGNNVGLQYAIDHNYEYVYLLNQDGWLFPNTIEELIRYHKNNPQYGILSPLQIQANGKSLDKNFENILVNGRSRTKIINDYFLGNSSNSCDVDFVMAAHWLISRECLLKVGGFSPTFFQYGEDGDYTARVLKHGFYIGVVYTAKAIHDREDRPISKSKLIYLTYVTCLTELTGFYNHSRYPMTWVILFSIWSSLKYFSIKPIWNLIKIVVKIKDIYTNKRASLNGFAFLTK